MHYHVSGAAVIAPSAPILPSKSLAVPSFPRPLRCCIVSAVCKRRPLPPRSAIDRSFTPTRPRPRQHHARVPPSIPPRAHARDLATPPSPKTCGAVPGDHLRTLTTHSDCSQHTTAFPRAAFPPPSRQGSIHRQLSHHRPTTANPPIMRP
jgi:hypothetical protein